MDGVKITQCSHTVDHVSPTLFHQVCWLLDFETWRVVDQSSAGLSLNVLHHGNRQMVKFCSFLRCSSLMLQIRILNQRRVISAGCQVFKFQLDLHETNMLTQEAAWSASRGGRWWWWRPGSLCAALLILSDLKSWIIHEMFLLARLQVFGAVPGQILVKSRWSQWSHCNIMKIKHTAGSSSYLCKIHTTIYFILSHLLTWGGDELHLQPTARGTPRCFVLNGGEDNFLFYSQLYWCGQSLIVIIIHPPSIFYHWMDDGHYYDDVFTS